ncbi:MAG: Wzz/FepE/Etk N-terminal domain-containing protein [Bacteroidota bacterium]
MNVEPQHYEIDLIDIWRTIKKSASFIVIFTVVAVLITGIITAVVPPMYRSSITFCFDGKKTLTPLPVLGSTFSQFMTAGGLSPLTGAAGITPELCAEVVASHSLRAEVLAITDLAPGDLDKLGESVSVVNKKSGAITISVTWNDPLIAYKLAQTFYDRYKEFVKREITKARDENMTLLEERYGKSKARLAKFEEDLRRHTRREGILYEQILREQQVAEQVYLFLAYQLELAKIAETNEENDILRVIDPAFVPGRKSSPSMKFNLAVAGFFAPFIGIGIAFFNEYVRGMRQRKNLNT